MIMFSATLVSRLAIIGVVLGVIALVLGLVARSRPEGRSRTVTGGITTGVIAIVVGVVNGIFGARLMTGGASDHPECQDHSDRLDRGSPPLTERAYWYQA